MCHAVLANEACAVNAESDRQVLYGHIVYDVVVAALEETGVYGHERPEAVLGHSAGECDGVALGNAHVKHAVGQRLLHDVH